VSVCVCVRARARVCVVVVCVVTVAYRVTRAAVRVIDTNKLTVKSGQSVLQLAKKLTSIIQPETSRSTINAFH